MEAARALADPLAERRARRFTAECEALRPQGVNFLVRHFATSLDRADAEDAVADVIFRLHRHAEAGRPPQNLRAAFFTSCRNAAIDQLRSRACKPTVALEAVAEAPLPGPTPAERAESGEDATRLREAIGRMRPNYREAIVLRFGLDLSVPEIAARLQISLPAAKKLVLRATAQVRERMESIEQAEFCPEMQKIAVRELFDRKAAGLADQTETAVLQAHFEHCGSCRSFLASLHDNLHELGSGLLVGAIAVDRSGALGHLASCVDHLTHGAQVGAAKLRLLAFKSTGAFGPDGSGAAGALAGSSQKIAALCSAGAATATCLAAGVVGPGVAAFDTSQTPPTHEVRPAQVKPAPQRTRPVAIETPAMSSTAAVPEAPTTKTTPKPPTDPVAGLRQRTEPVKSRSEAAAATQASEEFGFEGEAETSSTSSTAGASASSTSSTPPPPSSSGSSSGASSGGSGTESFGFGG